MALGVAPFVFGVGAMKGKIAAAIACSLVLLVPVATANAAERMHGGWHHGFNNPRHGWGHDRDHDSDDMHHGMGDRTHRGQTGSTTTTSTTMPAMDGGGVDSTTTTTMPDMPGMPGMTMTDGLSSTQDGYTFKLDQTSITANAQTNLIFEILDSSGQVQTNFADDMTKLVHMYIIRDDVTGFQHIHPTQNMPGMWSIPVTIPDAGSYRVFVQFIAVDSAGAQHEEVLSQPLSVPGNEVNVPVPAASDTATVDGYTVTLSGTPAASSEGTLTATFSQNGQPVTNLEPYLDSFAHLTGFNTQSLAFVHLHPMDTGATTVANGGPTLQFMTEFPAAGNYRIFLQFQTNGQLHTAEFTLPVQ